MDWVLYVYMAADNDLHEAAEDDFNQMSEALAADGQAARIAVVVLLDRSGTRWDGYYELQPGVTLMKAAKSVDTGELHTSDPRTLRGFLDWGQQRYHATHQALLFWSHGQGWRRMGEDYLKRLKRHLRTLHMAKARIDGLFGKLRGASLDDATFQELSDELGNWQLTDTQLQLLLEDLRLVRASQPEGTTLGSLPIHDDQSGDQAAYAGPKRPLLNRDVAQVLRDHEFSLLGFDACYMAMLETAYEFREKAATMVASEDDLSDWPLAESVRDLQQDSTMDSERFAGRILDHIPDSSVKTLSAIRLSAVEALAQQVSKLADALMASLDQAPGWIAAVRSCMTEFGKDKGVYHVDLLDLLDHLRKHRKDAALEPLIDGVASVENAVLIKNYRDRLHDGWHGLAHAQGLAIYFPPDGKAFRQDAYAHGDYNKPRDPPSSVAFVAEQTWANFINRYAQHGDRAPSSRPCKSCP